jgi:hypothetical protein
LADLSVRCQQPRPARLTERTIRNVRTRLTLSPATRRNSPKLIATAPAALTSKQPDFLRALHAMFDHCDQFK